jgi:hypothetical protein
MGERLVRALHERLGADLFALDAFDDWAVRAFKAASAMG